MSDPLRVCRVCGLKAWIEDDLELFEKNKDCLHGRAPLCKRCGVEIRRIARLKPKIPPPPYLRKCEVCGIEAWTLKDLERFRKNRVCLHGRAPLCKLCAAESAQKWRDEHPIRFRFQGMITRCYNKSTPQYLKYGAKGTIICDEWLEDPDAFIKWANENGFKPELQIDRIDNDGPYAPWNCRWVTPLQQAQNKRKKVTFPEKGTRICWMCKQEKPFSAFHKNSDDSYGHAKICRKCSVKYRRMRKSKSSLLRGKH